jgi:hypothetical protein
VSDEFEDLARSALDSPNGEHLPADRFTLDGTASQAALEIISKRPGSEDHADFKYHVGFATSQLRDLGIVNAEQIRDWIELHYVPRCRAWLNQSDLLKLIHKKLAEPKDFRCQRHNGGYSLDYCPECKKDAEEAERVANLYRFTPMNSAAFACADFTLKWLIKRLLVAGQPCILGGPKKALKTSLLIDLALSLGSGTSFLGQFTAYKKIRTVVISGESGPHTIQETARRVALAKGIDLAAADVLWDFRLPQLANAIELAELGRGIKESGAEVCIVDPLYLTLLAGQGQQGLQATNLFDMGPLLLRVADTCLKAGATPILAHHAKKGRTNGYEPLDLDELAFSGVAEFARQWLLLSRREAYEPGTGIHRLWLSAGGSIGHGGLWALDVAEGHLDDDFHGRGWEVSVMTAGDSREAQKDVREDQKAERQKQKDKADDTALLLAIDRLDPQREGAGYTKARESARFDSGRMTRAVDRLSGEGLVEVIDIEIIAGNGAKRPGKGIRRRTSEHRDLTSG